MWAQHPQDGVEPPDGKEYVAPYLQELDALLGVAVASHADEELQTLHDHIDNGIIDA
jgi:hypothetical protein